MTVASGARKNMAWDWLQVLNGAGVGAALTFTGSYLNNRRQAKAAEEQQKIKSDIGWNSRLITEGEAIRHELRERVAVLEHRADSLQNDLTAERRINEQLRDDNTRLRDANALLMARNEELQAENRQWAQQLSAMREQLAEITGRQNAHDAEESTP